MSEIDVTKLPQYPAFNAKWNELMTGIKIFLQYSDNLGKGSFDVKTYSTCFTIVYDLFSDPNLVLHNQEETTKVVVERCKKFISEYMESSLLPVLSQKGLHSSTDSLVSEIIRKWQSHELSVNYLRKLFQHFSRLNPNKNQESFPNLFLQAFKNQVFDEYVPQIREFLLKQVNDIRTGSTTVDTSLLKSGVSLFNELGFGKKQLYTEKWESPLLKSTKDFYEIFQKENMSQSAIADYLKKVEDVLSSEEELCEKFFIPQTKVTLIKEIERILIVDVANEIVGGNFDVLLDKNAFSDARRMFLLLRRTKKQNLISNAFQERIQREGDAIFQKFETSINPKHEKTDSGPSESTETEASIIVSSKTTELIKDYVDSLMNLNSESVGLISKHFDNDVDLFKAMKTGFEQFINSDVSLDSGNQQNQNILKIAEIFSIYFDDLVTNSDKSNEITTTSLEIDKKSKSLVELLGFIKDRDLFESYFKKQLCKRLLMHQFSFNASNSEESAILNLEHERNFIVALKTAFGAAFTSKLEGMMRDRASSENMHSNFANYLKEQPEYAANSKISIPEFHPSLLTQVFWPTFTIDKNFVLPGTEFQDLKLGFEKFYKTRTEGRKLAWIHALDSVTMVGNFEKGPKDIQMSLYQASILLLFNESDQSSEKKQITLSPSKISEFLGLPLTIVQKNLIPLLKKGTDLLKKVESSQKTIATTEKKKKTFSMQDLFEVNSQFASTKRKLNIQNPYFQITTQRERAVVEEKLSESRNFATDAAIIRVMKAQKMISFQDLILETSKQLMNYFQPDPILIKRRIEDLIGREFIERDDSDQKLFKYKP